MLVDHPIDRPFNERSSLPAAVVAYEDSIEVERQSRHRGEALFALTRAGLKIMEGDMILLRCSADGS